jgi:cytochrome c-type biogenesis protein CcmE
LKPRHKRIALIVGGLAVLGAVVALVLNAFQSNLVFFFSPTQVAAGEAPKGKPSASAAWSRKARSSAKPTA